MSKRFIDTNLFNDEWFNSLSKDGKLFFIYIITTCDHAGILKLNKKLCEFQTGIKSIVTVIKELGNSLVTLKEGLYFLPKFLKFQYPGFPRSNVRQQTGAISILLSHGLTTEKITEYLTLNKELTNSYDTEIVNDNEIGKGGVGENLTEMDKVFSVFSIYRAKIKKPIKAASTEAAKKSLIELSGNDIKVAEKIIEQSIANGWQGLFELKSNGRQTVNSKTDVIQEAINLLKASQTLSVPLMLQVFKNMPFEITRKIRKPNVELSQGAEMTLTHERKEAVIKFLNSKL